MKRETKTEGKGVEIRMDCLFDTAPTSESHLLGSHQQDILKGGEYRIDNLKHNVLPAQSHHAFSSVLGGGTREKFKIKNHTIRFN